jgi:hypothetical protein
MGFPVDTADGSVNVVDKLADGTLIAEDGSKLRPTTDALVSEVSEAAQATDEDPLAPIEEVLAELRAADEAARKEKADGNEDEEAPEDGAQAEVRLLKTGGKAAPSSLPRRFKEA